MSSSLGFIRRFSVKSSTMVKARKYIMVNQFQDEPKKKDVKIVEEELPQLKDGEYLCRAEYLSVDPYMRPYMKRYPEGSEMIGSQVARIIESKNKDFPVGKLVVGEFGWRDYTITGGNSTKPSFLSLPTYLLPDIGNLPPSLMLGSLGMPGNTAYFGILEICKPKPKETMVVTGAAGCVGCHAGQIAKIKGCKVIGFAGTDEKCKWLTEEMGFDYAYNYKTVDPIEAFKESAPNGIDCFYDNVGGALSGVVLNHMNKFGRNAVCGSISSYNTDDSNLPKVPMVQAVILHKELKLEGYLVDRWFSRWHEGVEQNLKWIQEGKLKYRETVTDGFENMFDAFIGVLRGKNIGKAMVKM